jgi:hypothetical protein
MTSPTDRSKLGSHQCRVARSYWRLCRRECGTRSRWLLSKSSFSRRWITKDNAATLACEALARLDLDLADIRVASVDLDGNDGPIVRSLLTAGLDPDVFVVEYNAKFPPPVEFELPYDDHHTWGNNDYFGVSLQRWVTIFSHAGYRLVTCNENGINAFFVKSSHSEQFADVPEKIEELYRIGHFCSFHRGGHDPSPRTIRHLATR